MAKTATDEFFVENTDTYNIVLGIHTRDREETFHATHNPFVFSDGSEFVAEGFLYQWALPSFPMYAAGRECAFVQNDGTLANFGCGSFAIKALCFVACPDSANSASERPRAKLPLLALFLVAGSVFNAFHAIAGLFF